MSGAIVQSVASAYDAGATSVTLNGVVAGNAIIVYVGWFGAGPTITGVNDGAAYSSDTLRQQTTDGQDGQVWYLLNAGAGTHTATVTWSSGPSFTRIRAVEVSGLLTSGAFDKSSFGDQNAPGTGANAITTSATATTTQDNEFILAFNQDTSESAPGTGTVTAGTGFTINGTDRMVAVESKSVTTVGAQTATFTQSTNQDALSTIVTFKEIAGPTPAVQTGFVGAFGRPRTRYAL